MRTVNTSKWEAWHLWATIALTAIGIALTWPAWADILTFATRDEEQSHIFLVPVVALWLFWARRSRLRICNPGGTFVGPLVVGAGWLMSTLGYESNLAAVWHAGAVTVVVGCILTILGKNVLFRFLPAFLVLAFLVPIPGVIREKIAVPLQTATAWVTQVMLEAFGFTLERRQNMLIVNGQEVGIAEACNGMRMVFALLLVSCAFAFTIPFRNHTRAIILLLSPVAALACNIVRLVPTVLVYGYASKSAGDQFHDISGWLMIPAAFFLLMGVHRVLRWAMVPVMRYNLAYE